MTCVDDISQVRVRYHPHEWDTCDWVVVAYLSVE